MILMYLTGLKCMYKILTSCSLCIIDDIGSSYTSSIPIIQSSVTLCCIMLILSILHKFTSNSQLLSTHHLHTHYTYFLFLQEC